MQLLTVKYTTTQSFWFCVSFQPYWYETWTTIQLARDDGLAGSFYLHTTAKYTTDVDTFLPYTL